MKTITKCSLCLSRILADRQKQENILISREMPTSAQGGWYHAVPRHCAFPGPLTKMLFKKDILNASSAKWMLPGYSVMMMNSLLSACTEFRKHNTTARKITCQISHSRQITSAPISLDDPSPKYRPGTLP